MCPSSHLYLYFSLSMSVSENSPAPIRANWCRRILEGRVTRVILLESIEDVGELKLYNRWRGGGGGER